MAYFVAVHHLPELEQILVKPYEHAIEIIII